MRVNKISIIIPVYNTAQYLMGCLDSIIAAIKRIPDNIQVEIICINDGSTDNSLAILQKYAAENDFFSIINQKNTGASAARNTGLEKASGDVIAFIDADDRIHPRYFEIMLRIMNKTNADAVACDNIRIPAEDFVEGWKPAEISETRIVSKMSHRGVLDTDHLNRYIWGRLYKRELIGENRFDTTLSLGEDTAFTLQIICKKEDLDFRYVKEVLYFYCQRDDSTVKNLDHSLVADCTRNVYLPHYEEFGKCKSIILEQAIRSLLLERYTDFIISKTDMLTEYQALLKACMIHLTDLSVGKRIIYRAFITFPATYRVFRILNDPSMLKMEKKLKALAK